MKDFPITILVQIVPKIKLQKIATILTAKIKRIWNFKEDDVGHFL